MNSFSILDYGAQPDTEEVQTKAIQSAIDDCFRHGGGEVRIPEGTFLTGGLRLRSNVTLHLLQKARLKGVRDPEQYGAAEEDTLEPLPPEDRTSNLYLERDKRTETEDPFGWIRHAGSRWNHGLLRAVHAQNVAIIGEEGSVLDGSNCYDAFGEEKYRGPHLINFFYCENLRFSGYTCVDSSNWAHAIFHCSNICASHLTVLAGHDGFHVRGCDNVTVEHCSFYTGDDCVAGFNNRNVLVADCEMNTACSAFRLGCTNGLIERCHFWGPARYVFRGSLTEEEKKAGGQPQKLPGHRYNMLSVFTYFADFSMPVRETPGHITIRDCRAENVDRFLHYNFSGNEIWQKAAPLHDITFENITARGIAMPLTAYGDETMKLSLTMKNVSISFAEGHEDMDFMQVCHFDRILLDHVSIRGLKTGALVRTWGDNGELKCLDLSWEGAEENRLVTADQPFRCQPI